MGAAWLPVLHTQRASPHDSDLFSNTARAHELGMTYDWVVVSPDDPAGHGQWTVINSRLGPLRGLRVIRGRGGECAARYTQRPKAPVPPSSPSNRDGRPQPEKADRRPGPCRP
jgi:DNA polymerase (family X)